MRRSFFFGNQVSVVDKFFNPQPNVFVEGEESSLFYGFETNGIYQTDDADIPSDAEPGDVRIVDQNEDGVIDDDGSELL